MTYGRLALWRCDQSHNVRKRNDDSAGVSDDYRAGPGAKQIVMRNHGQVGCVAEMQALAAAKSIGKGITHLPMD